MRVWWDKRLKVMRVSTIAIITTLIILLFFAGFTIYGNKVGNFVINVDLRNDIRLSLSAQEDLSQQTERLAYGALTELVDTTYEWLPKNITQKGMGNISDDERSRYMAYSFYLINNSARAVDCDMVLNLVDIVGDPVGMMRVMLIEEDAGTFSEGNRIYALKEDTPERKTAMETDLAVNHKPYTVDYFQIEKGDTEGPLFSVEIKDLDAGAHRRYTIVVWLEGCDLDTNSNHIGARAKMQLDITGY